MLSKTIMGLSVAAALSASATAQIRGPNEPVPNANNADAAGVNASTPSGRLPRRLAAGMEVRDSTGKTIGQIAEVGRSQNGQAAITVEVDGQAIGVPASDFRVSDGGDYVVSSLTKDQLKAGGAANPG